MKNKLLIWIVGIFFLIFSVQAENSYRVEKYILKDNATFDSSGNPITAGDLMRIHNWNVSTGDGTQATYVNDLSRNWMKLNNQNGVLEMNQSWKGVPSPNYSINLLWSLQNQIAASDDYLYLENQTTKIGIQWNAGQPNLRWQSGGLGCDNLALGSGGVFATGSGQIKNITLFVSSNSTYISCLVNGTSCTSNCTLNSKRGHDSFAIAQSNQGDIIYAGNLAVYNGTSLPQKNNNLFIVANNYFDNTQINNFSVAIFNPTFSTNISTTNGTVIFSNNLSGTKGNFTFNISSSENGGYFNISQNVSLDVDILNNLSFLPFQSIVYVSAQKRGSNVSIISFNVTSGLLSNQSNSSGGLRLYVNASPLIQFSGYSTGYFDISRNFSFGNLSINNVVVDFPNINTSISIQAITNGSFLHNFTVFLLSNSSQYSENLSDLDKGNATFSITNGTYQIKIVSPQIATYITTYTFQDNTTFYNLSFALYGLNSLNFSIFDENVNILMNTNVTLQLIGSNSINQNFSTQNGLLYVQNLVGDDYRVRYSASNYRNRDFYFTLLNGTNSSIKLYLLSIGNGTLTTFTLTDQNANPAVNFTVKAQRYYLVSSSYELVVMGRSDSQGKVQIDLEQNNPFYKFLITNNAGKIYIDTVPATIFLTAYSFKINTQANSFQNIRNANMIYRNLTFSNVTKSFTFTYNDPFALAQDVCLFANEIKLTGTLEVCKSCSSSSSATLVCDVTSSYNNNVTIVARVLTNEENSSSIYLGELIVTPTQKINEVLEKFGLMGVLMGFTITATMTMIGLWNPLVAMVLGTMGFVGSYLFGLITLGSGSLEWIIGIVLLAGILLYRSRA